MVAPLRVGIAGLGTVGAEVVRLIEAQSRTLSERSGRGVRVVAVTARSKAKNARWTCAASNGPKARWRWPTTPRSIVSLN